MNGSFLERKVDNLLSDLKEYIETHELSESEINILKEEIDKLLYECSYFKIKLLS